MYILLKGEEDLGLKLSLPGPSERPCLARGWDALFLYIGLLVGEPREAEPIRTPSEDVDHIRLSVYASHGDFCSIVAF